MVLIPVLYNNNQYKPTLYHKHSRPGKHPSSAHPQSRPGEHPLSAHPRNHTVWLPQGFGGLPNSLLRLWETPYATLLVFPALPVSRTLSNPARAGIPLWLGSSNTTSRTLSLCVWGLPEQTHYSFIIRHRSLALLQVRFINILHVYFGITQFTLYTSITLDITQFPDYKALSRHEYTTTLS